MTNETEVNVKLSPKNPMVTSVLDLVLASDLATQDQAIQTVADMLMATMIFAHMMDVGETDNLIGMMLAGQRDSAKAAHYLVERMNQDAGL
jgi:hypothetical protein